MRRLIVVASALVFAMPCAARADSFSTFGLNGRFASGTTLGGTVTVDTTTGVITDSELVLNFGLFEYDLAIAPTGQGPDMGAYYQFDYNNLLGPGTYLSLTVPTGSLVGYTGGPLCVQGSGCLASEDSYLVPAAGAPPDPLTQGSLAPVPEPGSFALLGGGVLVLATRLRGVKRA